ARAAHGERVEERTHGPTNPDRSSHELEEAILRDVLGVMDVSKDAPTGRKDEGRVPGDELGESGWVAIGPPTFKKRGVVRVHGDVASSSAPAANRIARRGSRKDIVAGLDDRNGSSRPSRRRLAAGESLELGSRSRATREP